VVGLDLDLHPGLPDGVARFHGLCDRHAGGPDCDGWPDTLTVVTASGGQHLYYRTAGLPIGSASGDRSPLGPGIDVRGPGRRSGGYLVGPGSTIAGRPYTVVRDTTIRDPAGMAGRTAGRPAGPSHRGSARILG
jgi:Bifunctional DNA primase/polymerase, N-terminal